MARPKDERRKPRRGEWYLRGPIPGAWIGTAAKLPGKCAQVGLALWFLVGMTNSRHVKLTPKTLRHFGVGRDAARECLHRLEASGLVVVQRKTGACPLVTVLDKIGNGDRNDCD